MGYLDQIIPEVRKTIESGYYVHKERERKSLVEAIEKAVSENRVPLIGEVKGFLPGKERVLKKGALAVAQAYVEAGCSALSIATDPLHMGGSLTLLNKTWKVPAIMEDFVIDEAQIGSGDAVVLILPLLDAADVDEDELIEIAHERELETILEVHSAAELSRAKRTETDAICINNRNWDTMELDASHTLGILAKERSDRLVLSGGGIETKEQVEALLKAGADSIVVGSSLMEADDVKKKVKELLSAKK
jgi:indole-3-glycerol phosphate synthase